MTTTTDEPASNRRASLDNVLERGCVRPASIPSPPLCALPPPPRCAVNARRRVFRGCRATSERRGNAIDSIRWNGGLLCCAALNGQLHCLVGVEYRESSRLIARERKAASHRSSTRPKRVLQCVVLGGRHEDGESSRDTIEREFWEETGRIVNRSALRQCLDHRGQTFDFPSSRYRLTLAVDAVHPSIVHAFHQRVAQSGYPDECCVQLHWVPWQTLRDVAVRRDVLELHAGFEPRTSRVPMSNFARMVLVQDERVCHWLDTLDAHVRTVSRGCVHTIAPRVAHDTSSGSVRAR